MNISSQQIARAANTMPLSRRTGLSSGARALATIGFQTAIRMIVGFILLASGSWCWSQDDASEFSTLSQTCQLSASSINAECIRANQAEFERLYFQGRISAANKVEIARQLVYSYGSSSSDTAALRQVLAKLDEYKDAEVAESARAEPAPVKTSHKKSHDPCSTGKVLLWGALAGFSRVPAGSATLPPGCAEAMNADASAASADTDASTSADSSSAAPAAIAPASYDPVSPSNGTPAQNPAGSGTRYIHGLPQCTRTQYQAQGASLWILNSCNVPVTVQFTSDSGNTWGQTDVTAAGRAEVTMIGIGYDPHKDGSVYLFTCRQGSQPVMPNGSPAVARTYRGQYTCLTY